MRAEVPGSKSEMSAQAEEPIEVGGIAPRALHPAEYRGRALPIERPRLVREMRLTVVVSEKARVRRLQLRPAPHRA